jgi:hypothetical protein
MAALAFDPLATSVWKPGSSDVDEHAKRSESALAPWGEELTTNANITPSVAARRRHPPIHLCLRTITFSVGSGESMRHLLQ